MNKPINKEWVNGLSYRKIAGEILDQAKQVVTKQRAEEYGNSFQHTCDLWSSYLGTTVSPQDFCMLMMLMKMSRHKIGSGKVTDTFIDLAGYASLAGGINADETQ